MSWTSGQKIPKAFPNFCSSARAWSLHIASYLFFVYCDCNDTPFSNCPLFFFTSWGWVNILRSTFWLTLDWVAFFIHGRESLLHQCSHKTCTSQGSLIIQVRGQQVCRLLYIRHISSLLLLPSAIRPYYYNMYIVWIGITCLGIVKYNSAFGFAASISLFDIFVIAVVLQTIYNRSSFCKSVVSDLLLATPVLTK